MQKQDKNLASPQKARLLLLTAGLSISLLACKPTASPPETKGDANTDSTPTTDQEKAPVEEKSPTNAGMTSASVGKVAPDFTLTDLDDKPFKLSDALGKTVVLEWFNPQCPFVKAAHTKGSLVDTAKKLQEKGVVYVAINSGAPGKQGHGKEVNQAGQETFKMTHPILLDESGEVGRAYGATNTPHLFVIDPKGVLVYSGAIDNSKDGEGQSPEGGTLINYVTSSVESVLSGSPVAVPETKAYGCSVKYGS